MKTEILLKLVEYVASLESRGKLAVEFYSLCDQLEAQIDKGRILDFYWV